MKRMSHWLMASGLGAMVFLGEFGCIVAGEPFSSAAAADQSAGEDSAPEIQEKERRPNTSLVVPQIDVNLPERQPVKNTPSSEPNSIIIETCEREPDEIAVPLNVDEDKLCHKVQAQAILAEAHSVTYLSADFTWSIADENIVRIIGGSPAHGPSVELEALYDIFSYADQTEEPHTVLTVCAKPHGGWKSPTAELCRSLSVYAVANMQGSWCFSGNNMFQPDPGADCQVLRIEQDGRFLRVDNYGRGTIYEKQLDFYWQDLEFRTNQSSLIEMQGLILAGEDVEGFFSAFRLPL